MQMVTMPSVNRQPERGLPMVMPQFGSLHSARSAVQCEDQLSRHPDAFADDCYLSDCQQLHLEKHPAEQFVRPSHMIPGNISDNERDTYDTLEKKQGSSSPKSSHEQCPGFGLATTSDGHTVFDSVGCMAPYDSMIQRTEVSLSKAIGEYQTTRGYVPRSLPLLDSSFLDECAEGATEDLDEAAISVTQPPDHHMISSGRISPVFLEHRDVAMVVRPASRRRTLSGCFSVGSDDDAEADTSISAEILQVDRTPSMQVNGVVNAEESDDVAFLDSLVQEGYSGQKTAYFVDLDDIPMVEVSNWLISYQQLPDLLFAGEDQASLSRFANLWNDPYAEPVDQTLFADFDADFYDSREVEDVSFVDQVDSEVKVHIASGTSDARHLVSQHSDSIRVAKHLRGEFLRRNTEQPATVSNCRISVSKKLYQLEIGKTF
jgi:hypothetical protein